MELAAIFAAHWEGFAATHRHLLTGAHYRAARAVMSCRTPELGGQLFECGSCSKRHFVYHSCNHRACPKCGGLEQKNWAAAQEAKLLPASYFMLTFTLPNELRRFAYQHQQWFYELMFEAATETLRDFSHDPRHLGGTPGFTAVLHTWTRQMQHHPHLHVIMPGVALSKDGLRLKRAKIHKYLFPVEALADAFRNRLRRLLQQRDASESTQHLGALDAQVWGLAWVVDARAVGRGHTALRYLARYVHKSAVSQARLLGYNAEGCLRLNCQDSTSGRWHVVVLSPDEFLRRWCLHILPKGFIRVRHYGFLSAAASAKLQRLHEILQSTPAPKPRPMAPAKPLCPCCGTEMILRCELQRAPAWPSPLPQLVLSARAPPP